MASNEIAEGETRAVAAAAPHRDGVPGSLNPGSGSPALERVRGSFARQGAMKLIGARMVDLREGYCALALTPRPEVSQQHGFVHAGIVATLVDSAGGYAGYSLFPDDSSVLTVEFKLNLLTPAQGEEIVAEGFVVKSGRTLTITRGEVHAVQAGARKLVAIMQQTLMTMHGRRDGE